MKYLIGAKLQISNKNMFWKCIIEICAVLNLMENLFYFDYKGKYMLFILPEMCSKFLFCSQNPKETYKGNGYNLNKFLQLLSNQLI